MNYKIAPLLSLLVLTLSSANACGRNEVPSDCVNPCQPTCQRLTPPDCQFLVCNKGCVCAPGYILSNPGGKCIPVELCKQFCGPNQIFREGGTACPPTCEDPTPEACIKIGVTGCFCKEGLLLKDNQCVLPCNC